MAATTPARAPQDLALLVIRLALGGTMIIHGYQKAVLNTIAGTQQGFTQMGMPLPELTSVLVTLLELGGGALIVLGLLTRVVALLYAVTMAGALVLVHLPNGFFVSENGFEFVAVLAAVCLALVIGGPGRAALDHAIFGRRRAARAAARQPEPATASETV